MTNKYESLIVYFNGEFVPWEEANVHIFTPFTKYGAAVFEGIRGYWCEEAKKLRIFRLEEHMQRMETSQKIMRFDEVISAVNMCEATIELMKRNNFRTSVHIRPTAYVDGDGESSAQGPIGSFITAIPRGTPKRVETGCTAQVSSWERFSDRAMPARAKVNGNYNNSRLSGIQAKIDGYDAAILLNNRGKISEGQGMCIFLVRDGVAVTPSITSDILESITRDTVIRLFEGMGVEVQQRDIDRSELFSAEEAFFCGTGWEITPINMVDGASIGDGSPGALTRQLQGVYFDLLFGRSTDKWSWVTTV